MEIMALCGVLSVTFINFVNNRLLLAINGSQR
jgi:hypothetical protein